MLFSPIQIHDLLSSLLSVNTKDGHGLHTAMLLVPQGQLLACATTGYVAPDGSMSAQELEDLNEEDEAHASGDEEDGDEEPYLDRPERLRLLSGLASQWEEDESPRVECELGRLLLVPVRLPGPEAVQANAPLPTLIPTEVQSFTLALNATSQTQWSDLIQKGVEFTQQWKDIVG